MWHRCSGAPAGGVPEGAEHGRVSGDAGDDAIEAALLMAQGMSEGKLTQNVMFGSAARDAVNFTAGWCARPAAARSTRSPWPTASSRVAGTFRLVPAFLTRGAKSQTRQGRNHRFSWNPGVDRRRRCSDISSLGR